MMHRSLSLLLNGILNGILLATVFSSLGQIAIAEEKKTDDLLNECFERVGLSRAAECETDRIFSAPGDDNLEDMESLFPNDFAAPTDGPTPSLGQPVD